MLVSGQGGVYPVALRIHPIEIELALKTFPAVESPPAVLLLLLLRVFFG